MHCWLIVVSSLAAVLWIKQKDWLMQVSYSNEDGKSKAQFPRHGLSPVRDHKHF